MRQSYFFQESSILANHLQRFFPSQTIGLLVGAYDFLNVGHRFSLEAAKQTCDLLVIGLLPDAEIQKKSGNLRPFQPLSERAEMLLGTQYVDYVIPLAFPMEAFFQNLQPHKIFQMVSLQKTSSLCQEMVSDLPIERHFIEMDEHEATDYGIAKVSEKWPSPLLHPLDGYAGYSPNLTPHPRIIPATQFSAFLKQQHAKKTPLITTNGSFDLLHLGHLRYLQQAKAQGGNLLVLVNDDASICQNKGKQRPIFNQMERMNALAMLKCVDYVLPFTGQTPLPYLAQIKPQLHVKGGSFEKERIAQEKKLIESQGGYFQTFDMVSGFSSTNLLEKLAPLFR